MYHCLCCGTDRYSSVRSLAADSVSLREFISSCAINMQQNYLPGMYHKLFSGSCKQKGAKVFYMLQVFKLVGSLERKKKKNRERERKKESLWKQSFHSANGVSQTNTVTTYKAGPKNPEGKSLCYDGRTQPEEKIALKLELAYP